MMAFLRPVGIAAALLVLVPGCVTKGRYDLLASDRDSVAAERDSLAERAAALERELSSTRLEREEALASLAASEAEMASLEDTFGALVSELQAEVDSGQIKIRQLADGLHLELAQEILFTSGSAALDPQGRNVLGRVAGQIKDELALISVEGHSDNVPIRGALKQRYPTNWELAGARASSVVRLLTESGVDPQSMEAVSRGPFVPVASNDTFEGRARNRRIEILIRPAAN